jgi:hypothetical protein
VCVHICECVLYCNVCGTGESTRRRQGMDSLDVEEQVAGDSQIAETLAACAPLAETVNDDSTDATASIGEQQALL